MQVILLAAGRSFRLDPIADKSLLEFNGKTLIEHQVLALKHANLRDIVVVGGAHNIPAFKSILKSYKNVVIVEQKDLDEGMAGGVLAGAKSVNHKNILVVSSNDVVDPELFVKVVEESKKAAEGLIVGKNVETYFPGGYIKFDKDKNVTDIIEKPIEGKEPSNWVNLVVHVYNNFPKFVDVLKKAKSKKDDVYEVALYDYIKKGKAKMKLFKYLGVWQPIKYPWHILRVMEHFLGTMEKRIDRSAQIAKTAIIDGPVYIGPKAKIMPNAVIHGPAYIGANSVIGNNALVRQSMIGNNCVIGFSSEVTRSYINHDVWTHTTYIGDSIVDNNVSFGSGTVLGNLRFDEGNIKVNIKKDRMDSGQGKLGAIIGSGARFGINCSTNPGVKIGQNTFVGPNVLVDEDLADNKLVLLKQTLKVSENKAQADTKGRK